MSCVSVGHFVFSSEIWQRQKEKTWFHPKPDTIYVPLFYQYKFLQRRKKSIVSAIKATQMYKTPRSFNGFGPTSPRKYRRLIYLHFGDNRQTHKWLKKNQYTEYGSKPPGIFSL